VKRSAQKPAKVAAKTPKTPMAKTAKPPIAPVIAPDALIDEPSDAPIDAPIVAAPAIDGEAVAPAMVAIGTDTAPLHPLDQKPMTEKDIVVEYQRVGRDLAKLQNDRGTDKVLDLWPTFKAIKLSEQCKTIEGRLDLEGTLKQLRARIDRRRGITISAECLNNPLAAQCQ
jgi:hypothetical protein